MSTVTPTSPAVPTTILNLGNATTPLSGGEFIAVVQNGVTLRATVHQVVGAQVLSLNSLTGAINLTSIGNTISITEAGSSLNLEAISSGYFTPTYTFIPPAGYGIYEPSVGDIGFAVGGQPSFYIAYPVSPNVYTPASGSMIGQYIATIGGANPYTIPGIGPSPSAGQMFITANYADSTSGNISNIYSVAQNTGSRFCSSVTSVGISASAGSFAWAYQGVGIGTLTGANVTGGEIDILIGSEASSIVGINLNLQIGEYGAFTTNATTACLINLASTSQYIKANTLIQINDATGFNPVTSGGAVLANDSTNLSCAYGINFTGATFSTAAFKSTGFTIDGSGNITGNNLNLPSGGAIISSATGDDYLIFSSVASAVNEWTLGNASTGNAPYLLASGSDTNINGFFSSKGTGNLNFFSNGVATLQVSILNTTSAAHNMTLTGGTNPAVGTSGGSLSLTSSSGTVQFGSSGSFTANGTGNASLTGTAITGHLTVTEWLTILDSGGTTRYIPCF